MAKLNLYFAAGVACMTGALFGYSVGFIGGILVLPSFLRHFSLNDIPPDQLASQQSAIVSAWIVGALFGVPLAMPICSRFGRRQGLKFAALLYLLGGVLQLLDFGAQLGSFEVGRLINGLGVGAGTLVSPIYIAEISTPEQRGTLMGGYQVAIQLCALIGFWGAYVANVVIEPSSDLQWQIPVAIQLVPGTLLLVGALLIVESPLWLAEKESMDSIRRSLAWLRNMDENEFDVVREANTIYASAQATAELHRAAGQKNFFVEAFRKPIRKRLGVGIGLMIAQNMVGLNALNYFAAVIFMTAGFKSISASLFLTGLFGLVKVFGAMTFMFLTVKIFGNRFWLLIGSGICAISMFTLAYCVGTTDTSDGEETGKMTVKGLISVLMVYVFSFSFSLSLGPISWNFCSECFPSRLNAKCCAVTTCTQWLFQIVVASMTPILLAKIGSITFVVYGVFCVLSFIFCALWVPETRGVALGKDMDAVFGDDSKDDDPGVVEEIEDVSEVSPLLAQRARRRSSIAIVV